jgi:ankyrin repeat protein
LTVGCRHGETALHIAAVENHLDTARLLLQRGASVNEDAL